MLPARDRITKLYIYSTEADMLADTNGTEYTQGIVDGSQRFEHTFFSAFPSFGETNAAMYECEISGTGDLTGKYIRVKYCYYATAAASTRTDMWLFAGKIDKCTYDRNKTARSVTAYDKLYELRSVDVSAWWTTYWASQSANKTYAQFVTDMCSAFGVTTDWANLTDASASIIYTAAQNIKLSGCSFANMLHYIGQLTRYSWFIRANGKLGRSYMHNNIAQTNIDSVIDATETEYGDEPLSAYSAVMAYDGADVIYTYGSGSPTWTIRDNPLLKGKTTAQISTELDTLRTRLAATAGYYPLDAEVVVSSPDVLNVDYDNLRNLQTTDGNLTRKHVIGTIELWGSQLINQRIICPSEMEQGDSLSPSMSAALSEIQKMGVEMTYKVNADGVIEAVNAEASESVKIRAEAIDLNGVVTANQNFKINLDGSMETIAGKIGGWSISDSGLYKESTYTSYSCIDAPITGEQQGALRFVDVDENVPSRVRITDVNANEVRLENVQAGDHCVTEMRNEVAATLLDPPAKHGFFTGGWYQKAGTTGVTNYSELTPETLKVANHDILRTHQSLVGGWGTAIPANANLNTDGYCEVGRFYVGSDSTAATHTNCPTRYAYMMDVFAPISSDYENTSYIVREIRTRYGDRYVQYVTGSTTKSYSKWAMQLSSASDNKVFSDQITSRNIADNSSIRNGSFDGQGQETSSSTRIRTGYVGVISNTQYGIRTNTTLQVYEIHEYTSSQTFIKYTSVNSSSTILKTSSTTRYIRILMRYSDNRSLTPDEGAKLQIERGEQLSAYSPYEATDMEVTVPPYTYTDLGTASTHSAFFQAWLKRIAVNFDSWGTKVLQGRVTPNDSGVVHGMMHGGVTSDGLPRYSGFTYVSAGILKYFGTNNGTFYLRSVNYTSEV